MTYWNSPLARESHVNLKHKGVGYPSPICFLPIILLDRLGIKKVNGWGTPPPIHFSHHPLQIVWYKTLSM